MSELQTLAAKDRRIETGALKVGDDWPGIFIRGDDALAYAHAIDMVLENPEDPIFKFMLAGLATLLRSCDARNHD